MISDYKTLIKEIRHRYMLKYDVNLDDEILYLIIRINELQVDLKKDIEALKKPKPRTSKEFFWYGLGQSLIISIVCLLAFVLTCILVYSK